MSRPHPNPRRGLLRAFFTVVILSVVLLGAILVISSLTAPKANAPVTPPTPGPITPVTAPTAKSSQTATVRATPSSTKKVKRLGLRGGTAPEPSLLEQAPSLALLRASTAPQGVVVHALTRTAWFTVRNGNVTAATLSVRFRDGGRVRSVASADSLVRPVWNSTGSALLFASTSQRSATATTLWNLREYDIAHNTVRTVAEAQGISLVPLGWEGGHPLYLVGNTSDTSAYVQVGGRARSLGVVAPQILTTAVLSPTQPLIAFAAPTNCFACTLEFFDLRTGKAWSGPTGVESESDLVWTADGRHLLAQLGGRTILVSASRGSGIVQAGDAIAAGHWQHSLLASLGRGRVTVSDQVTGWSASRALQSPTS